MATTSKGCIYPQLHLIPSFDDLRPPDGSNVCAFPTRSQLLPLIDHLSQLKLDVVSIGCGEGYLEGLLEQLDIKVCRYANFHGILSNISTQAVLMS